MASEAQSTITDNKHAVGSVVSKSSFTYAHE